MQPLPWSILYFAYINFWLFFFVFNFATITDLMLWKLKIFYLTTSNSSVVISLYSSSCTCHEQLCIFCHLLAPVHSEFYILTLKWYSFLHIFLPYARHLHCSNVLLQYCAVAYCEFLSCLLLFHQMHSFLALAFFMTSTSLLTLEASFGTFWALFLNPPGPWRYLFPGDIMYPFGCISSYIIFFIISLSLVLLINCSFSLLYFPYTHNICLYSEVAHLSFAVLFSCEFRVLQ